MRSCTRHGGAGGAGAGGDVVGGDAFERVYEVVVVVVDAWWGYSGGGTRWTRFDASSCCQLYVL